MKRWWGVALLALVGCSSMGDHERRGDAAYAAGGYATAFREYQAALQRDENARLLAKAGAAATRSGELTAAVDAYRRLAADEPNRAWEAVMGLHRVAQQAQWDGDDAALRAAAAAVRRLAPSGLARRYALPLLQQSDLGRSELLALLPEAIAAAPGPQVVDSLLLVYGAALRNQGHCARAAQAYASAFRRSSVAEVRERAAEGLGSCALTLASAAFAVGDLAGARTWFAQVVATDSTSVQGRRALLGLGRVRGREGDRRGAEAAYRAVIRLGSSSDSIAVAAATLLEELPPETPVRDSMRLREL